MPPTSGRWPTGCCRSAREVYASTQFDVNWEKIAPGDLQLGDGDHEGNRVAGRLRERRGQIIEHMLVHAGREDLNFR